MAKAFDKLIFCVVLSIVTVLPSSVSGRLEQTRPDTPAESPPINCFPKKFVILEHVNIVVISTSLVIDDIVTEDATRDVLDVIVDT
jgi:hypothetical protein